MKIVNKICLPELKEFLAVVFVLNEELEVEGKIPNWANSAQKSPPPHPGPLDPLNPAEAPELKLPKDGGG